MLLVASPRDLFLELLFLVYVNDLSNSSRSLDSIKLADDTNLFFNHKDIKHLLAVVNKELVNIKIGSLKISYVSLNVEIRIFMCIFKYSFFHKPSKKDDIPLRLPKLIINNHEIQIEDLIKFFGVLLDLHLTWKNT